MYNLGNEVESGVFGVVHHNTSHNEPYSKD